MRMGVRQMKAEYMYGLITDVRHADEGVDVMLTYPQSRRRRHE
jgi:hypothetical protein